MAYPNYKSRFFTPPEEESYFLFGPRGAGKSTWLFHHYPQATRIDLLLSDVEARFLAHPELLRGIALALKPGSVLILDEIQRVPALLSEVHALIEQHLGIQFILTGSSARKLRRAVSDLLGGRALLRHIGPFFAAEVADNFSVEKALQTGLIPLIWESKDPEDKLRNYLFLYLKQEVQAEGIVRNIGDFHRFLETASFSYASLWTSTDVGRDANVKRATVDNYFQILEDLFLAFSVPVFSRRAKRRLVAHPKFYFFDVGVFRALRPRGVLDSLAEIEGAALEGLVAQHLYSWVNAQKAPHTLSFWRTQNHLEVDFVVYGPRGFWAIEVKRSPNLGPDDLRGMKAFKEEYPEATVCFVVPCQHREIYRDFLIIPLHEFLLSIKPAEPLRCS